MSEFSDWFKDTFKKCYCEHGNLIDEQRFAEIVQLVLDNEADDESRSIFEQKIKSCVKSNFTFEKEKRIKDEIKRKLCEHKAEMPMNLVETIRKSVDI
ncbi:hypothetical protein [Roseivirga thermotolerans]|uniref:hypothetical protein n=1 Tax=Roseivirga thermotolerans TaxID=1758176 RepID=UPI00273F18AC|nr:hypothetical protein [Roseivirga thermotolerans]